MSAAPLRPDEVHTFPGICDDHPPDDLSTIALAPLEDDGGILQAEGMQTDDNFRRELLPVAPSLLGSFGESATTSPVVRGGGAQTMALSLPEVSSPPLVGTVPGMGGRVLKQEIPSPTDLAEAGTSAATSSDAYPGSTQCSSGSIAVWGQASSSGSGHVPSTPSPSSPVIPITALELLSRDSDSSSSDAELPPSQGNLRSEVSVTSAGSIRQRSSSTSGKTLDRRKGSDNGDSDELTYDEDMTPDDQDRLDRRRLSNRVAAQKCRQRQRQHYRGLMKEIQDWECKNTGLNYEVRQLQKTLRQMIKQVEDHDAQCTVTTPVLTPDEKQAYQKLLDDVTAAQSESKGSGKSSK